MSLTFSIFIIMCWFVGLFVFFCLEFIELPGCVGYYFLNKFGKCSVIIYLNIYTHTLFEYIYTYIYIYFYFFSSPLSPLSSGSYIFDYVGALSGAHFCLWLLSFFFILFSLCSSSCIISTRQLWVGGETLMVLLLQGRKPPD